jgi:hypothetical protein
MSFAEDPRLEQARAIPIADIAHKFGLDGLTRATANEMVGPCPKCGGHEKRNADRFSINTMRDVFHCRQCPAGGDGIGLVQHILDCDFATALEALCGERPHEVDPAERARRRQESADREAAREAAAAKYQKNAINAAKKIWGNAEPGAGSLAEGYMRARGIVFEAWPRSLRFAPDLPYWRKINGTGREWHRGPAMVAAITDAAGKLTAVHMTWIDLMRPKAKALILGPDGQAQPAKLMRGSKKGGAIRLTEWREAPVMMMGEGIETTATAMVSDVDPSAAYWAGADLGNMAGLMVKSGKRGTLSGAPDLTDTRAFVPPDWVDRFVLLEDGDSEPVSTRAKLMCAVRRAQHAKPGRTAAIVAAGTGHDFNDILTGAQAPAIEKNNKGMTHE